jgi:hypothetical protein
MKLFDDIERTDSGIMGGTESQFAFVNRSAKPLFSKTRDLVQEWFDEVSTKGYDKKDIRARFRSNDEKSHVGALFELYCHGLLRHQGFDIELHQSGDGTTTRLPDFSVSRAGEQLFYLESTLAADTLMDDASRKRIEEFLERVNSLESLNYGLIVDYDGGPENQISSRKAKHFLRGKISQLEQHAEAAGSWPSEEGITWVYEDQDFEIRFSPMLRDIADRGKPGLPLLRMGSSGGTVQPEKTLYSSIKRKATAYGDLTSPYVVAIDTADDFAGDHDVLDALFGPYRYQACRDMSGHDRRTIAKVRDPKGGAAFLDPQGNPENTRVSGVLVAYNVKTTRLAVSETPVLWHNPWAKNPLASELWQGPQVMIDPETFETTGRPGFDYKEYLSKRLDYYW